jgi:hypothetical protein
MLKEAHDFEQDFLLLTETEMRVRQATQCTQLDTVIVPNPHMDVWEWEASNLEDDQVSNKYFDEERVTVWERTIEQL